MNRERCQPPVIAGSMLAIVMIATVCRCLGNYAAPDPPSYANKTNLLVFRDSDGLEHAVQNRDHWERRRRDILASMQLVMGPLPDRSRKVPLRIRIVEENRKPGCTLKKIRFAVEADDDLPAWLLVPNELTNKAPAMLCLHQTTPIGKDEPVGLGGKENLRYALELARRGYVTLSPDYPNFGEYKIDCYARGYASATMKGIWNHMRAVDVLQSLPEVNGERIGVMGHSLGGHNALFVAVFDQRIKAIVTSCGFNSFSEYNKGDLSGWSHAGYMPWIASVYGKEAARMPFDFTEVLAAIAPRPVFINAPLQDDNFPVKGVRDCVAAARPVYELLAAERMLNVQYPDAGHDFPKPVRQAAYEWLDRWLK